MNLVFGVGSVVVVCILIIVLCIQLQVRGISEKVDQILQKLNS